STKRAVVCGAFRRMGWRGLRSLRDATRTAYPIDQESDRKAEQSVRMGWRGFLGISNRPREKK
ncbi:hypothetical protein ACP6PL_24080, partial [Dapis sp. BLCC M126]|uniref:hypothetical protein n=1 Tax=Dapis sp. BLCC M126 TaxID=3400189 RepID=UPI003CE96329